MTDDCNSGILHRVAAADADLQRDKHDRRRHKKGEMTDEQTCIDSTWEGRNQTSADIDVARRMLPVQAEALHMDEGEMTDEEFMGLAARCERLETERDLALAEVERLRAENDQLRVSRTFSGPFPKARLTEIHDVE